MKSAANIFEAYALTKVADPVEAIIFRASALFFVLLLPNIIGHEAFGIA